MAAYFRSGGNEQPSADSRVVLHNDLQYVVLTNVNGTLAVYRIRNDGMLKRLKRWPETLDGTEVAVQAGLAALAGLDRVEMQIKQGVKEGWLSEDAARRLLTFS